MDCLTIDDHSHQGILFICQCRMCVCVCVWGGGGGEGGEMGAWVEGRSLATLHPKSEV